MPDPIQQLNELIAEVVDLRNAAGLLVWDERVNMPPGGAPVHGNMAATIRRLAHEKFISPEIGEALDRARTSIASQAPDSDASRLVKLISRDYERAARVPPDYVAEHARATTAAHQAWRAARESSDFSVFAPHLHTIVSLKQRYVSFFEPLAHPYDALLDDYEPGALTSEISAMFDGLRPSLVQLVRDIQERPAAGDRFLHETYPEPEMLEFAVEVITRFGFDWSRGRQDKSAHPFAVPIGSDDVRITTRFDDRHPFETAFSTMHEAGHALYEQGVSPVWERTLARGGASLGMHESQSRLWENVVGRSRPFWDCFYPSLQRRFHAQLGSISVAEFYRAINTVRPSLIRVEADEVTYNLHVMLRVEIEIALLTGTIAPADAPEFFNTKMREYLGLVPADATTGVLQDMHWAIGLFGYFATYTLGNLISVQLWEKFTADEPSWADELRTGNFRPLREWLRLHVHQYGRSYEPRELVERITGRPMSTAPFLTYLSTKYGELYGVFLER